MHLHRPLVVAIACALLTACATQPPAPGAPATPAATTAPAADAGQQLNALFERYFEDTLRLNPVLATFIGDHRYDDQLPNSIGPKFRQEATGSLGAAEFFEKPIAVEPFIAAVKRLLHDDDDIDEVLPDSNSVVEALSRRGRGHASSQDDGKPPHKGHHP